MASALSRLIAANEAARQPIDIPHRADPSIVVRFSPIDVDGLSAAATVPQSDDRGLRQACAMLVASCREIVEDDGTSVHPDGDTVTFSSAWLASGLGVGGPDGFDPADVVSAFYPLGGDVMTVFLELQRESGLDRPNPTRATRP